MAISNVCSFLFFLCLTSPSFSSPLSNHPQAYVVFVSKSHKPTLFSSYHHWYSSILNSLPPSPHTPKLLYTYNPFLSGFAAHVTYDQAVALRQVSGVNSVVPDHIYQLHTTHTPRYLGLSSGSGLLPNGDYGEDIIIGVLDTGVWPGHPSYSDSGLSDVPERWNGTCETSDDFPASSCNKKLIGARAFYKGSYVYQGKPIDGSTSTVSPRDTEGHGTHTSTTAAGSLVQNASFYGYAKGTARGMASKARIAAYKICWSHGCSGIDILAAMGKAVEDGVDVISFSVGDEGLAGQYYEDFTAIGAFSLVNYGVIVSCSAGNAGPSPHTAVNIAPWILTVGASTIDREFRANVVLGNGITYSGISLYTGEPLADEMFPLVYAGKVGSSRFCTNGSLDSSKVQGKIVLCDSGVNTGQEKGNEVMHAGGVGMIVRYYEDLDMIWYDAYLIAAATVSFSDGNKIINYINSHKSPTAKIVFLGTIIGDSPPSPKVASFSSRGPNYVTAEILKPDVIAPGVNILAGWTGDAAPTELDNDDRRVQFWLVSGTSMSCPHVSGIAALLHKANPDWSPAAIKSALITTAYNLDNSGETIGNTDTGKASTPFDRGAGHVDPNAAIDPGLVYDMNRDDYVGFLCAIGYSLNQISIFLHGEVPPADTCDRLGIGNPGNLNYPSFAVVFDANSSTITYTRVVKNVGSSADAIYNVTVNAPANVDVKVSPNSLVFSEEKKVSSYEIMFSSTISGLGLSSSSSQSFGSIEWSDGTHKVRSPIAVIWQQGLSIASF